jgi:hypothetical protein
MKPEPPKSRAVPRRPILSVSDALHFAADQLAKMSLDQSLVALIGGALKGKDDLLKEAPAEIRIMLLEPERQERCLDEAAKIVRDLANEHAVLALRTKEPTV